MPVSALRVDYRDVGPQRADRRQRLAGERADDVGDAGGVGRQARAAVAAHDGERQARRARHEPVRHPGVAVLLQLKRMRPGVLDRVPESVQ